ncbi:hypothetical protein Tco_1320416 [Tanacetum coccineum]
MRRSMTRSLQMHEVVHKELSDSLVRVATTVSSLEAEQDSGNINKTRSKATPNESSSIGTTSGGGPRCQETIGNSIAQTRFKNVSKHFNDSLITRGNILRSDEDRLKLNELMELCTNLQKKVLDLEKIMTTQGNEISSLKSRVKKIEKRNRSRTHWLKRLYKVGLSARIESSTDEQSLGEDSSKQGRRISAIDAGKDITLVNVQGDAEMFDVDALNGEEVFVVGQNENIVEEVVDAAKKDFDKHTKRVNTFVDFRTDLVEGSSKRAGEELEQESTKKQKVDEDKDTAELQSLMEVIPDEEEVAIDVVPLAN